MDHILTLKSTIDQIKKDKMLTSEQFIMAKTLMSSDDWVLLTQSSDAVRIGFSRADEDKIVEIGIEDDHVYYKKNNKVIDWDEMGLAALMLCHDNASWMPDSQAGRKYTREGMIRRVLEERREKALDADYRVKLADNIYGEHALTNEKGQTFLITLWDINKDMGYIDNIDWRTNKLGTTKHIMYLCNYLKRRPSKLKKLKKRYPFIEITLDPLNDYKITWVYPHTLDQEDEVILARYFKNKKWIEDCDIPAFLGFISLTHGNDHFKIRPEVLEKINRSFDLQTAEIKCKGVTLDYSLIKTELHPYQKEGVEFVLSKPGAIIADEMGLGKTIQAIAIGIFKQKIFGFKKILVVCPASIKHQWKSEIEKFTDSRAVVIDGKPEYRKELYTSDNYDFYIVNYEMVLRDLKAINSSSFDFVILDEAQKIKNYSTKTATTIKKIKKQHALVITGTPIENKLVDLYSIMQFIDPYLLTPLWELSYQYCMFDHKSKNRIIGYYNLNELKQKLTSVLIRREKRKVLDQLPSISQKNIYLKMHDEQTRHHAGFMSGVAFILAKKFKTSFDWQRLMILLNSMRMACDSTYLVDKESNFSTKLIELRHVLTERLDLHNNTRKVIIFSEWINMLNLIGDVLKSEGLGFVMLTGSVPVKKRKDLIKEFETNDDCRIFLSTEAGGTGLNLQMADVVINFELPWNPAKKNQRIGRIDRLGQTSKKLTVLNLITTGTIEEKIATGLLLKQNLFDGVLNIGTDIDEVDFSEKGRAQFIRQLELAIEELEQQKDIEKDIADDVFEELEHELFDELSEGPRQLDEELAEEDAQVPDELDKADEKYEELETVLNSGMDFLSGIYKMSSGKELQSKDKGSIQIDRETGEVTMKFKIII